MTGPVLLLSALLAWTGATLLLSDRRWARRAPLVERIGPYLPGFGGATARAGMLSGSSFRDVLGPSLHRIAGRATRILGVSEELEVRLERIHAPLDVHGFRLRQLGWCVAALVAAAALCVAAAPPAPVVALALLGAPFLAFALAEHQVLTRSQAWQRRLEAELPVVAEQLGMLLSAGYSLGSSLQRLAARSHGACAADLGRAVNRTQQGLTETDALGEWAALARVDAVDRLVAVLALNRAAGDLGRLISDEARTIRQEAHRRQIAIIERRGQQVWIPVTVAALVPGTVFLAVPFLDAMALYGGG